MKQINNASHIGSLFGPEESFAVGKLQLAWLQPPRRCLLASARAPAGEPQKRLPGYLHGHIKNAPKNAAGDQLSHSGGHFQVICMSRYKCMPQRELPRPLLACSRGCCRGTRPGTKQHGPRGEAVANPVCAHRTPARVLRGTAPRGSISTQGPASRLDRSPPLLCRLQTCKAERLPDLELFPSLAQLRPSLSSHTTAEQLSTAPPAPHLQCPPSKSHAWPPQGRPALCPVGCTLLPWGSSPHGSCGADQAACSSRETSGHLGRKIK